MPENIIGQGVSSIKKLPPVALVGIVVVGVGGVLYIRSRGGVGGGDTGAPESIPSYQPEQVVALERQLPGALPQPVQPGQPNIGTAAGDSGGAIVPPRQDTKIPDAKPVRAIEPFVPTTSQGLPPITSQPITTQPVGGSQTNPTPPVAVPPPATVSPPQTYEPIQEVKQYPGYPNNFEPTRAMVQDTSGLHSWAELVAMEKSKGPGWNNTAQQRNLAQIAIGGTARKGVQTKGSAYPGVSATNTNRIWTNNVRVSAGLRPLQGKEWNEAAAYMSQLWNGDERAQIYQSGEYARLIFERYNLPYRYV